MGQAKKRKEAQQRQTWATVQEVARVAQALTIFQDPAVRVAVADRMVRRGLVHA